MAYSINEFATGGYIQPSNINTTISNSSGRVVINSSGNFSTKTSIDSARVQQKINEVQAKMDALAYASQAASHALNTIYEPKPTAWQRLWAFFKRVV